MKHGCPQCVPIVVCAPEPTEVVWISRVVSHPLCFRRPLAVSPVIIPNMDSMSTTDSRRHRYNFEESGDDDDEDQRCAHAVP